MAGPNTTRRDLLSAAATTLLGTGSAAAFAQTGASPLSAEDPGFLQAGAGAVRRALADKVRELEVSVFDFLSPEEAADVRAYRFGRDVTRAIDAAIDHAYRNAMRLRFPPGGYSVTQLVLPDTTASEFRGYPFEMVGAGRGEAFAVEEEQRGTIVRGRDPGRATLRIAQRADSQGTGTLDIHGFRFEGRQGRGVPVADVEALYGPSRLHDCDFYQEGDGDGLRLGFVATGTIEHCYTLNADWNAPGRGERRGTGLILRTDRSCGLQTLRKITSRGWRVGYDIGNESGPEILFSPLIEECECSVVTDGIRLRPRVWKGKLRGCYFEGVEGTCVVNEGNYTTIEDGSFGIGFRVGIDDGSDANIGTLIAGNALQVATGAPATIIRVTSTGALGGPGKTVRDNNLTWSGSGRATPNVVGIEIAGIDPRIDLSGNSFAPRGAWIGGAGTAKILDRSTSGDGGAVSRGSYGFGVQANGGQEFPALNRGSVSLGVPEAPLGDAAIASGVLETGDGSFFLLSPARRSRIERFGRRRQEGQWLKLYCTNGMPTFVHGAHLKLAGSADFTPPPNGAVLTFVLTGSSGGWPVAIESAGRVLF
jgi:hypothetical protein